jgi:hypothetical protein
VATGATMLMHRQATKYTSAQQVRHRTRPCQLILHGRTRLQRIHQTRAMNPNNLSHAYTPTNIDIIHRQSPRMTLLALAPLESAQRFSSSQQETHRRKLAHQVKQHRTRGKRYTLPILSRSAPIRRTNLQDKADANSPRI